MPDLERPTPSSEPIDASALDRESLSSLKVGTRVTNINGTTSIWRVMRPGILKRITEGEAADA